MKLVASRDALLRLLKPCANIASPIIPIWSMALLSAQNGYLHAAASNGDMWFKGSAEAMVDRGGEICAPAARLHDLVATFPDEAVSLELRGARLHISCGRSRFALGTLPPEGWPQTGEQAFKVSLKIAGPVLSSLLIRSVTHIPDKGAPAWSGVYIGPSDHGAIVQGSDGHRLVRHFLSALEIDLSFGIIVPAETCAIFGKLCAAEEEITLDIGESMIRVTAPSFALSSKLIDSEYPATDSILAHETSARFTVNRDLLMAAARRMAGVVEGADHAIFLAAAENGLLVTTPKDPDHEDFVPAVIETPLTARVAVNAQYLLDSLKMCGDEAVVTLATHSKTRLLYFADLADGTWRGVLAGLHYT